MAREEVLTCDICRKKTERIAAKINYIPSIPGVSRGIHSNYTHTADVGICCADKVLKLFNFRKRQTAEEYRQRGRANGNRGQGKDRTPSTRT